MNFLGWLASAELPGGERAEYGYDHQGLLVRARVERPGEPAREVRYLVDPNHRSGHAQVAAELEPGEVRFHTWTHRLAASRALGGAGAARTTYYATDALGSVRAELDETGAATATRRCGAWGRALAGSASSGADLSGDASSGAGLSAEALAKADERYGYAGERTSPMTGLSCSPCLGKSKPSRAQTARDRTQTSLTRCLKKPVHSSPRL